MVLNLINDLRSIPEIGRIILTLNIPEPTLYSSASSLAGIHIIQNPIPFGFGKNHNQASKYCSNEYFCILNPDVRIYSNPFRQLLPELTHEVALVAPLIVNAEGQIEDSARYFPTPLNIFSRIMGFSSGRYPLGSADAMCEPDWIAGMFLLIKRPCFESIFGFDERYFLYLEDADLSLRLWKSGFKIRLCKGASVVHMAQRASHKKIKYLMLHISSLIRFFICNLGRLPKR